MGVSEVVRAAEFVLPLLTGMRKKRYRRGVVENHELFHYLRLIKVQKIPAMTCPVVDVYRDIFSRTDLTAKSKLLLLYLLLRGEGEFHFSPTRVAVRMGCSRQMVKSALRELERRGFLTREHINPLGKRYLYRVRFPII